MKRVMQNTLAGIVLSGLTVTEVYAAIDPAAAVVELRVTCTDINGTLDNCFTDLNTLNNWINTTRQPDASNPLLVNIGPGEHSGQFICSNMPESPGAYTGYVTLRGSGKANTVITNPSYPISIIGCTDLEFRELTVLSSGFAVQGGGSETTWYDVEVKTTSAFYAWFDRNSSGCYVPTKGKHYWYSSQIISEYSGPLDAATYQASCDESWFFGSEIIARKGSSMGSASAFKLGDFPGAKRGEVHVYGSVIRVISDPGKSATLIPVQAHNNAQVHIHGTGIDAIGDSGNTIIALKASSGGEIHANESSYVLKNGTNANITRIDNDGGHVHAPYLWESHSAPPTISSQDKSDMVVADDGNGNPVLLIYSTACTSGWYNIADKVCRP